MEKYSRIDQEKHLESWKKSGLTAADYSRNNGIKTQTFYSWIKTAKKRKQKESETRSGFVKITSPKISDRSGSETILFEYGKMKFHIPESSMENLLPIILPILESSHVY